MEPGGVARMDGSAIALSRPGPASRQVAPRNRAHTTARPTVPSSACRRPCKLRRDLAEALRAKAGRWPDTRCDARRGPLAASSVSWMVAKGFSRGQAIKAGLTSIGLRLLKPSEPHGAESSSRARGVHAAPLALHLGSRDAHGAGSLHA